MSGRAKNLPTSTRALPRQATSYMSFPGDPPAADDPLLAFAPVPHTAPRKNSITADRQREFIAHLAATGIVAQAARHIGASLEALYKLRKRPGAAGFDAAWDAAVDRGVARLEDSALARAIAGEERLVVSAGKVLGTEIRHNDALVMFFLKNRRAQRYGAGIEKGHPLYERIRAEVIAELREQARANKDEVIVSLNAKLELMRARTAEVDAMLARDSNDGAGADDGLSHEMPAHDVRTGQ